MNLLFPFQVLYRGGLFGNFLFIMLYIHSYLPGEIVCLYNVTTFSETRIRATPKSYYNGLFRRFAFPPGTLLIFEPELTLPTWRAYSASEKRSNQNQESFQNCDSIFPRNGLNPDDDVAAIKNAAIQISSPFFVYFDKLGWTHEDSLFNPSRRVGSYIQEYVIDPTLQIFGVPPLQQATSKKRGHENKREGGKDNVLSLSELHRVQMFHKIESLLEEIGAENGRACLLRTICELHEFPFDTGRFGIFGEILTLIFSASPDFKNTHTKVYQCLDIYARAEKYGRTKGCTRYVKYCEFSIFHWYWKMTKA